MTPAFALLLLVASFIPASATATNVCADRHVGAAGLKVFDGSPCAAWTAYVCEPRYYGGPPGIVWTCIPISGCTFCPGPVIGARPPSLADADIVALA